MPRSIHSVATSSSLTDGYGRPKIILTKGVCSGAVKPKRSRLHI